MADFKKYGMVRLIWGVRIRHEFNGSIEALEWRERLTKSWRRHFVSASMVYNDADCTDKMLKEFDMLRFQCDSEDYGFHRAYEWVQEGKYGFEGIPEILIQPKRCEDTTE